MKFVCTFKKAIDDGMIYPGTYDVKIDEDQYIVKVSDDFNLISTKEELLDCGYFDCSMDKRAMDEETLLEAYKAVKEEKRKMEEERRNIYKNDKITDEQRDEFLTENQAAIRGLNHALHAIRSLGK